MGQVLMKWDSTVILCQDMNIDIINVNDPAYRLYRDILKGRGLTQHVTQPTRNNHVILDHITTNIASRVKHTGVIQCPEINDHECPYIIFTVKSKPFELRYKIIRSMKDFDQQHCKETFASLPFTATFALNDPESQLGILNDLIIKHLEEHAPMKRIRVTRQPAPWMRDSDIVSLKNDCRHLRHQCHQTNKDDGKKCISFDPETLNNYYTTMAENFTGAKPTTRNEITQQINALSSSSNQEQFYLQKVNYNQVLHEIKSVNVPLVPTTCP